MGRNQFANGVLLSSAVATTSQKIGTVRVSVLKTATWRRAGFAEAALVEHVCVARNVVAAASPRAAECAFLQSKYVGDFGRELTPLEAVVKVDLPLVRVDLWLVDGEIYGSKLTLTSAGGNGQFDFSTAGRLCDSLIFGMVA